MTSFLLATPLFLCAPLLISSPAQAAELEIAHEQYQLDNGLNVILHEDHSLPQIVVNTWYQVGSKDEVAGRSGFAHLFEHLMFMGTERLTDSGFDDLMESKGGWNNAWTSEDATDYYDVGPSHLVDLFLWMEADRMDGLDAAMTQAKLDLQRDVVRNERRQSVEDTPYGIIWEALPPALYPEGHPYAHSVIGTHADLQAAEVEDVLGFFRTWYVPNNASLVVAGDFAPTRIKALIAKNYGHLEPATLPPNRPAVAPPPTPDGPVTPLVELTDQVQLPLTMMVWHSPAALKVGDAAHDLAAAVLADGQASRLYQRLVVKDGLAVEVEAYQYSQLLSSVFIVEAKPTEGHSLEEIEAAVHEEIARLAAEGPTAEELDRVKNQVGYSFLSGLESLPARAAALNRYHAITGNPAHVAADLARYGTVDAGAVQATAALLNPDRALTMRVHPEVTE